MHTSEYGPLNQPITAHLVPERYNEINEARDCIGLSIDGYAYWPL